MTLYHQPILTPAQRATQLAVAHREFVRRQWRRWLARGAGVLSALGAGLMLMAWGFHTTDQGRGAIAFYGGLLVGNGGILLVLLVSYLNAVEAGDV